MSMKRFLLILIILTCVFTSCNTTNSCDVESTVSATITATPEDIISINENENGITILHPCYAKPESIEKIITKSYSIVKGTLINVEQDAKINNKKHYTFKIDEYIKGNLDDMDEVVVTMFDFEANVNCTMCENTYENGDKFILPLIKN